MLHNYIKANDFSETGWNQFARKIIEIKEAKTAGDIKVLNKKFNDLSLALKNYDFVEVALMKWWVYTKLKQ